MKKTDRSTDIWRRLKENLKAEFEVAPVVKLHFGGRLPWDIGKNGKHYNRPQHDASKSCYWMPIAILGPFTNRRLLCRLADTAKTAVRGLGTSAEGGACECAATADTAPIVSALYSREALRTGSSSVAYR